MFSFSLRRRLYRFLLALIGFWIFCGILSLRVTLPVPSETNPNFHSQFHDYAGTIHFHTAFSDGSGTVAEILQAGRNANLSFLIATDHGEEDSAKITEGAHPSPPGSRENSIFLFSGSEIGTESGHHLCVGDMKIVAHPYHPFIPWKEPDRLSDFNGLEILNGSAFAQSALKKVLPMLGALALYPFNSDYSFLTIYEYPFREMDLWDKCNLKKKTVGIASTDAHANIPVWKELGWRIKFPSYDSLFRMTKMHLPMTENLHSLPFSKVKKLLYNSIKQGNCYFAFDLLLDPEGFSFRATRKGGAAKQSPSRGAAKRSVGMGESIALEKNRRAVMQIQLGKKIPSVPKEIRLLKNGSVVATTNSEGLEFEVSESGVYRAEVYLMIKNLWGIKKKVLWIGSNPIFVTANR